MYDYKEEALREEVRKPRDLQAKAEIVSRKTSELVSPGSFRSFRQKWPLVVNNTLLAPLLREKTKDVPKQFGSFPPKGEKRLSVLVACVLTC